MLPVDLLSKLFEIVIVESVKVNNKAPKVIAGQIFMIPCTLKYLLAFLQTAQI